MCASCTYKNHIVTGEASSSAHLIWSTICHFNACQYTLDLTSMLIKRRGIMIKRMIHRKYEMMGNKISSSSSLSPLGDRRKTVSKLKSPAVIDRIFIIELAGVENGDRYRKQKPYIAAW